MTAPIPTATRQMANQVVRLRVWGTDVIYPLLPRRHVAVLIGTSDACAVQLDDPFVAALHAQLVFDGSWWMTRTDPSHALLHDGVARERLVLAAGDEITIGATTLIAESTRTARMRAFVQRLLGWGDDRLSAVDHALRAMRMAMGRRASLLITADSEVVSVAHALHQHMHDDNAPFIVCNPGRRNGPATVRSPANLKRGAEAFGAAGGGSLCLLSWRLPHDVDEVMALACVPGSTVRVIVCVPRVHRSVALAGMSSIEVPPLALREQELPRIVDEYADEAVAALGVIPSAFTDDDRNWIVKHASRSHLEIEKATRRLIALRTCQGVQKTAARLGMAPVSLERWLGRRPPLQLARDVRISMAPPRRSGSKVMTA